MHPSLSSVTTPSVFWRIVPEVNALCPALLGRARRYLGSVEPQFNALHAGVGEDVGQGV